MHRQWQVSELENNLPLLEALALRIPAAPKAFLHQLCKKGRLLRCGETLSAASILFAGERLHCPVSARLAELISASHLEPEAILYEDRNVMVINKPAGLAVHRAKGHEDNLQARLQQFLRCRGQHYQVAPAHRLDIGTSGPVLFGKGRQAISLLGQLFMAGEIDKSYLALVHGEPPQSGELQTPITMRGKAKEALTRFRRIAGKDQQSLLLLQLVTGRTHQIRQQLAVAGWPIIGDQRYGGTDGQGLTHPFLHSVEIRFTPPGSGTRRQILAPLPDALQDRLDRCGLTGSWPVADRPETC